MDDNQAMAPIELIEERERKIVVRMTGTFLGAALVVNSFIANAFFGDSQIAGICAMTGAIILAMPIIFSAGADLLHGEQKMREIVALAVISCIALQDYQTAGIVAFFMLMAELVETRAAIGAHAALQNLIGLSPKKARVLQDDGSEVEVEADKVLPGQTLLVRPGENIPADGLILEGASAVNEATITGESMPADKVAGKEVFAGTTNLTSLLRLRVSRAGHNTVLGKVRTLIVQAQQTKLPIMRIVDRYIKWYTPVVIMVAGTIFFFTREVTRAITALVVSCPTAIILAMPTAMVAALACAARMGVLIKNTGDIEVAGNLDTVVFDKTGTLTTGELVAKRLLPVEGTSAEELLRISASVEKHSNHPMAKAIVDIAKEAEIALDECKKVKEVAGRGVSAVLGDKSVLIGREQWLKEQGVVDTTNLKSDEEMQGLSSIFVAVNGKMVGCVGLEDKTREEAKHAVDELKKLGMRQVIMFTGDREAVAKKVSGELGCSSFEAECLPERKLQLVGAMKEKGYSVVVVGDGVNDAPALAAGDIGVAMGAASSDVAINSASIALMSSDLSRLPFLIRLSKKAMGIVYQNLGFGLACIIGGLILSGMGILTPIIAAVFYLSSSLVVVFNSARLVGYGGRKLTS